MFVYMHMYVCVWEWIYVSCIDRGLYIQKLTQDFDSKCYFKLQKAVIYINQCLNISVHFQLSIIPSNLIKTFTECEKWV